MVKQNSWIGIYLASQEGLCCMYLSENSLCMQ